MRKVFRDDMALIFRQSMNFNISDKFIDLLDAVLTNTFEKEIGIIKKREILGGLDPDSYTSDTSKNIYSIVGSCIINFLYQKVHVSWHIKSNKPFALDSEEFDPDDLDFEISGINWPRVKKAWNRVFLEDVLIKKNKGKIIPRFFQFSNAKLFLSEYDIELTDSFIDCANSQLTILFEKETALEIKKIDIHLSFSKQEQPLSYHSDIISSISGMIYFKYGNHPVNILWKSTSGRIYKLTDDDVDCTDIEFWFEHLDVESCRSYVHPKWSLISPIRIDNTIKSFKKEGISLSKSFLACADKQLSSLFESKTGIKIDKEIFLISKDRGNLYSSDNLISKLRAGIYVNHNWNNITIAWKSKSGKIYKPDDENIDCNDLEFWFEEFDPLLYYNQYYPKIKAPLNIKNLGFELLILRINLISIFTMHLKNRPENDITAIIDSINGFINNYNEKSEKKKRINGVIHSWQTIHEDSKIVCTIDLGSTGINFIRGLLKYLSKLNSFDKVVVS